MVMCAFFMTRTPVGSTETGFMEKPGIEPATPGLQGIALSPTPRQLLEMFLMGGGGGGGNITDLVIWSSRAM